MINDTNTSIINYVAANSSLFNYITNNDTLLKALIESKDGSILNSLTLADASIINLIEKYNTELTNKINSNDSSINSKVDKFNAKFNTINGNINTLETSVAELDTQSSKYLTSINEATTTALGGIKIGYFDSEKNVAVKLEDQKAYVTLTDVAIKKALGFTPAAQNENGEAYTLPTASDVKLGGIKTGYTPTGVNANKELPVT